MSVQNREMKMKILCLLIVGTISAEDKILGSDSFDTVETANGRCGKVNAYE